MQIFKFGGASVKDANGVKNLAHVLETVGYNNTLIVVSAMGKTTESVNTHYATSEDGVRWEKPSLNLYEWRGSRLA